MLARDNYQILPTTYFPHARIVEEYLSEDPQCVICVSKYVCPSSWVNCIGYQQIPNATLIYSSQFLGQDGRHKSVYINSLDLSKKCNSCTCIWLITWILWLKSQVKDLRVVLRYPALMCVGCCLLGEYVGWEDTGTYRWVAGTNWAGSDIEICGLRRGEHWGTVSFTVRCGLNLHGRKQDYLWHSAGILGRLAPACSNDHANLPMLYQLSAGALGRTITCKLLFHVFIVQYLIVWEIWLIAVGERVARLLW